MEKPQDKPVNPSFSCGPCAKRPGWSLEALESALVGRSHRAGPAKDRLKSVIDKHKSLLGIPEDYYVGIVPGSDTGAFEMAMWSLLGQRGVDVFAWESFSGDWLKDITDELKLEDVRTYEADYGALPDLSQDDPGRDTVFAWNGTTSGVRVPNGDWISENREGLTLCDATSAVFAYDLPWKKLDVVTWSWQKGLGSEAAHGMLVLSPRAVERLESYESPRPLPKLFRLLKKDKLNEGIFKGVTINTPSMLAVEDCLDALNWAESIGGLQETTSRCQQSFDAIEKWLKSSDWSDFLAEEPATRSISSVCLKITDEWFQSLPVKADGDELSQSSLIAEICKMLEGENVAFDIKGYRDASPGLRIWCGPTVEPSDVEKLLPWLDWAYATAKSGKQQKAA